MNDPWWYRHPFWTMTLAFAGLVALSFGAWGAKVALSPVKGAGDVVIQQNDADNMIKAQAELRKRYEGLEAACARIPIAKQAADADPGNRVLAANYTGAQQQYISLVTEYNALTRTLLAQNMLGDLPRRVDPSNCTGVN